MCRTFDIYGLYVLVVVFVIDKDGEFDSDHIKKYVFHQGMLLKKIYFLITELIII